MFLHKYPPFCSNNRISRKLGHCYSIRIWIVSTTCIIWASSHIISSSSSRLQFVFKDSMLTLRVHNLTSQSLVTWQFDRARSGTIFGTDIAILLAKKTPKNLVSLIDLYKKSFVMHSAIEISWKQVYVIYTLITMLSWLSAPMFGQVEMNFLVMR